MFSIIFSPLSYLRIRHSKKWITDWFYPTIFTSLSLVLLWRFGNVNTITGHGGLLDRIITVCSILPGFYIAALAAIATFNRPDIDEIMPDPAPRLSVDIGGNSNVIDLTRRRFLAYLFAFLCWESLTLLIICIFLSLAVGEHHLYLSKYHFDLTALAVLILLLAFFWQMICATFLGLYYLGDRLNRPTL